MIRHELASAGAWIQETSGSLSGNRNAQGASTLGVRVSPSEGGSRETPMVVRMAPGQPAARSSRIA